MEQAGSGFLTMIDSYKGYGHDKEPKVILNRPGFVVLCLCDLLFQEEASSEEQIGTTSRGMLSGELQDLYQSLVRKDLHQNHIGEGYSFESFRLTPEAVIKVLRTALDDVDTIAANEVTKENFKKAMESAFYKALMKEKQKDLMERVLMEAEAQRVFIEERAPMIERALRVLIEERDFVKAELVEELMGKRTLIEEKLKDFRENLRKVHMESKEAYPEDAKTMAELNGADDAYNENEQRLIQALLNNPKITYNQLAQELGVSTRTAARTLASLVEKEQIERVGNNRTGYWKILR